MRPDLLVATRLIALAILLYAMVLLWNGDSASGAVATAAAFGLILLQFAPLITEVSGFGITAKLRREIEQAEDALMKIRAVSHLIASASYIQIAYEGRWGSPPLELTRKRIAQLDQLMENTGVSPEERETSRKPLMRMISFDLMQTVRSLLVSQSALKAQAIDERLQSMDAQAKATDEAQQLIAERERLMQQPRTPNASDGEQLDNLSDTLDRLIADSRLNALEKKQAKMEAARAVEIYEECLRQGNVTAASVAFNVQRVEKEEGHRRRVFGK